MKTLSIALLTLVSGIVLASENKMDHSKMDHSKHSQMDHHSGHDHGKENKQFNEVLKKYEDLHQAFFENDNKKIKNTATRVASSIEKITDEKITKNLKFTVQKLKSIAASDDLEANKKAFNTISQGLLFVLEKHAPNTSYKRYFCPMVKKYWIQNVSKSDKTFNPYASSTMPNCGGPKSVKL